MSRTPKRAGPLFPRTAPRPEAAEADPWASDDPVAQIATLVGRGLFLWVGIDPGMSGALGILGINGAQQVEGGGVFDLPTVLDPGSVKTKRRGYDLPVLWLWLSSLPATAVVTLEKFQAIPAAAASKLHPAKVGNPEHLLPGSEHRGMEANNVRQAGTHGELRGLLAAAQQVRGFVRRADPSPATYRAKLEIKTSDKELLRQAARRMFPRLEHRLSTKSAHNRAEALLLALYGGQAKS